MFIYVLTMFLRSWNRLCFNVVSVLSCWRFQWYWIYFQQHSNLWHWGKGNKEITRTLQVWGLRVLPWVCIGILTVYRFKWPDSQRRVMDELDSDIKRSHKGDEVKVIARTGSSSQKNLVGHQEGWGPMDGYILSKVILMMVEACGAMASPDHWYCISNKQWLHLYTCTYIYIYWYHCSFEEEKSKKEEEEKADKKPEEDLCCCVWLHFRERKGRLTNVLPPLI